MASIYKFWNTFKYFRTYSVHAYLVLNLCTCSTVWVNMDTFSLPHIITVLTEADSSSLVISKANLAQFCFIKTTSTVFIDVFDAVRRTKFSTKDGLTKAES